ncbi:MAG TPA: class III lanthionine synthetase LanKC [Streptosporangiaceae bacterium]
MRDEQYCLAGTPDRPTQCTSPPPRTWVPAVPVPRSSVRAVPATRSAAEPRFLVRRVLHVSPGRVVYAAQDPLSGEAVVLKEARRCQPARAGADGVTRLAHERSIMELLAGVPAVPSVRGYFAIGRRTYLVQDRVEGTPLDRLLRERHPLRDPVAAPASEPAAGAERAVAYTAWALRVYERVAAAVAQVHRRGVALGSLSPSTILIRPDGTVALVDFAAAARVGAAGIGAAGVQGRADPGFAAPPGRSGFDLDRYALACLRLALFLPLTAMVMGWPDKTAHLAEIIAAHFPVPRGFLDAAVAEIGPARRGGAAGDAAHPVLEPGPAGWERARAGLTAAILASATPTHDDRLFPADIELSGAGALAIAHGAAGVLYALDAAGAGRYPEYEAWLARRALRCHPEDGRLGFYDGLHGVAYVLDHLCRRDEALKLIEQCMGTGWERLGIDLGGGLAGIALNLRHFGRQAGEPTLYDAAVRAADIVADRLGDQDEVAASDEAGGSHAGLFDGASGPALLFIRMFEDTGDPAWLDRAADALARDLRGYATGPDGALRLDRGRGTAASLGRGAAGIAVVLDEYLTHRMDERFRAASAAIRLGLRAPFVPRSGLFNGRAGILVSLAGRYQPGRAFADADVALHIRNLAWHAVSYRGHLAFPGDRLDRLSMDLASGTAGVLLALGAALHHEPVALPLLEPGHRATGT